LADGSSNIGSLNEQITKIFSDKPQGTANAIGGLVCDGSFHMGEVRNAYNILVRKSEGKRPLGRRRRRWEDNIKMDLTEMGGGRCGTNASGSG
jgi:hypothetical protein